MNEAASDSNKEDTSVNSNTRGAKESSSLFIADRTDNTDEAAERFGRDGFLRLKSIIPQETIQEWFDWSMGVHIPHIFETLHRNGYTSFPQPQRRRSDDDDDDTSIEYSMKGGCGVKHGFKEIVMRSPGRYEIAVLRNNNDVPPNQHPSLDEIQAKLLPLLNAILLQDDDDNDDDDLKLLHVSIVLASSGATDQGWHADGGHVNLQQHAPCHVLNVFIPLVDITRDIGPTELRPASHILTRNLVPMLLAAKARKTLQAPVVPELERGDVLMFDYRILHRGRANNSSTSQRPILCLTYSKSWFKDICNFPNNSLYDTITEKKEKVSSSS